MDGKLFESRIGRLIACIVFNVMVLLPLVIEIATRGLSNSNGYTYVWALILCWLTPLHYFGNMTRVPVLSFLARLLHAVAFAVGTAIILISQRIVSEYSVVTNLQNAKELGYFAFLYLTNALLNGINGTKQEQGLMGMQNYRWILLFAAGILVIPVCLAFKNILTYQSAVSLCTFFIFFYLLYMITSPTVNFSFIGFLTMAIIAVVALVLDIVSYSKGVCSVINAVNISFAALVIAYFISVILLGGIRDRDITELGKNEIAISIVFPFAMVLASIGLGFVSLIKIWAIAVSAPVSMLVLYILIKCLIFPKESDKEREKRGVYYGPLDLLPNHTNRDVAEAICGKISDANLVCASNSHEFLGHARARVTASSGNTIYVCVYYQINFHPEDRSQPSASEHKQLQSSAYNGVRNYFNKYQKYFTAPWFVDFSY